MKRLKKIGCIIRLGTILEGLISIISLGWGKDIAKTIANKLGYESCYCDERRILMNKWTCPEYNESIKLK